MEAIVRAARAVRAVVDTAVGILTCRRALPSFLRGRGCTDRAVMEGIKILTVVLEVHRGGIVSVLGGSALRTSW